MATDDEIQAALDRLDADEYLPCNGDIEQDANGEPTGYIRRAGQWDDDVTTIVDEYRRLHAKEKRG